MMIRNHANQEALNHRAENLGKFNGIEFIIVNITTTDQNLPQALLEIHFYNNFNISQIRNDPSSADTIFSISGGHRILGGHGESEVKATKILKVGSADNVVELIVFPIGDYSTYTLSLNYDLIDPIFSDIEFKFRPGCFTNNCSPGESAHSRPDEPSIDYLAKDFDSFKHVMISAMMERVPGWQPTSEADLDQVLIDQICVAADELSDYQDRVVNESFLTARKRISLARHARLMDYHIHQGNQASTLLSVLLSDIGNADFALEPGFKVDTSTNNSAHSVAFVTKDEVHFHALLSSLELYTWQDSYLTLYAGTTAADLKCSNKVSAEEIQKRIHGGLVPHLLIQECLNPETGRELGNDKNKRQLLRLLQGDKGAEVRQDPLTGDWFVHVSWEQEDMLKHDYCFVTTKDNKRNERISLFHGNLVWVYAGEIKHGTTDTDDKDLYIEITNSDQESDCYLGAVCTLPYGPLLYEKTPPGGETPPKSTLAVAVKANGSLIRNLWTEVISFIHSGESDEHYVVETDENGMSIIRFGNGINGKKLPKTVQVECSYQIGHGPDGNVGRDKLVNFDRISYPSIARCWNPIDVTNGREPEPVSEIIRRVPEAYVSRQERAITLKDYQDEIKKVPGVSNSSACYLWTGSWRTVRITVDPVGTTHLSPDLKKNCALRLEALKLIGEDFEIRGAAYVPLEIRVTLCVNCNYWIDDIRPIIEKQFSNGYKPEGTMAFFHPDKWTFGQGIRSSQITGWLQAIEGVDYVIHVEMKRLNDVEYNRSGEIKLNANEILQVENNPDHMESGYIDFEFQGGRA